ncbi:hypothetical protein ACNQGB_11780 [Flavobacterium sp. XS1P32]|uniref:hypothetical protein n=1 Tax=Flavobacterium sp. XS1P32 TaxID=3401726 RepID=UPI003AAC77E5
MRKILFATDRCKLFKNIATDVWNRIQLAHDVNVDLPEIGITADILVDILQFSKYHISNFDVYAEKGWKENIYGSDINVFVETNIGQYRWFALQAKILKKNNRYDTLRDSSDLIMQWDKLTLLEGVSGCKGYYLLYNGKYDFSYSGADLCENIFNEEQFGCSLVEPSIIEELAGIKDSNGRYINPKFEDIHPHSAQPWRVLTCCYHDTNNFILYSKNEIIASNPNLKKVDFYKKNEDSNLDLNENEKTNDKSFKIVEGNKINMACKEANWNPSLSIIVSRTDGLIQSNYE